MIPSTNSIKNNNNNNLGESNMIKEKVINNPTLYLTELDNVVP